MSHKHAKITAIVDEFQGQDLDAHYLGYFACFNRQLFFEAHEVLEQIWLPQRHGPNGAFYKGLIQLAGAFVHLQKNRSGPAAALAGQFAEPPKGEITLVLGPGDEGEPADAVAAAEAVAQLVADGVARRQAAGIVARLTGLSRKQLYDMSL